MSFTRSTGPAPNWPSLVPIVTGVASSYTPLATDYYIGVNGTGVTITLPTGAITGKTYLIKNESGLVASNPAYRVTVEGPIDGQTAFIIAVNYGAVNVLWTGTKWSIF
jgi:hypothetical protein